MKIILAALSIILSLYGFASGNAVLPARANGAAESYLLMTADTVLYAPGENGYAPVCVMPKTYFTAAIGVQQDGYLPVSFMDITGFVAAAEIQPVDYEPVTKYPSRGATVTNDGLGANLRALPQSRAKIVSALPENAALAVYGEISGDAIYQQLSDKWLYVKYQNGDTLMRGYVYSAHVTADPITENDIRAVVPEQTDPPAVTDDAIVLSVKMQIILIVALSVPAAGVMLLIFRRKGDRKKRERLPRHYEQD